MDGRSGADDENWAFTEPDHDAIKQATMFVRGEIPKPVGDNDDAWVATEAKKRFTEKFEFQHAMTIPVIQESIRRSAERAEEHFSAGRLRDAAAEALVMLSVLAAWGDDLMEDTDDFMMGMFAPEMFTLLSAAGKRNVLSEESEIALTNMFADLELPGQALNR